MELGKPHVETIHRWSIENGPAVPLDYFANEIAGRVELVKATLHDDGEIVVDVFARKLLKNGEVDTRTRGLQYVGIEAGRDFADAARRWIETH